MEKISFKDFKNGKGFYDTYLRDDLIIQLNNEGLKDNDILINFAYTDYGGDFFDKVCIEYFSNKKYSNCFSWHKTVYYGKNGILWGKIAKEFIEAYENYPLGYEDIEDFYYQKEDNAKVKGILEILDDYKYNDSELSKDLKDLILEDLRQNSIDLFTVMSGGQLDYLSEKVENEIERYIKEVYPLILSKQRENLTDSQYFNKIV